MKLLPSQSRPTVIKASKIRIASVTGVVPALAMAMFLFSGCQPPSDNAAKDAKSKNAAHDHDHDHGAHDDHDHADHGHDAHAHADHGPNGGHLVHLEPSGAHAEWTHEDETGKIVVYVNEIEELGKKVDSVKVVLKIGDQPEKPFDFKAGEKSVYELTSPELLTAIQMTGPAKPEAGSNKQATAPKVAAKLVVTVDGKENAASIEESDHHHH